MAARRAGDVTVPLVSPSHVVQAALTALNPDSGESGRSPYATWMPLCIKGWSKIRRLSQRALTREQTSRKLKTIV